jgi:SpoVK/Ycf46/Vps4 family AAA+-type ATPase
LPKDIAKVNLFYNSQEEKSLKDLVNITSEKKFNSFLERMSDQNMHPGLTILLYGAPGTGKTEFVNQLARENDRPILQVDYSKIRDKWVGNSEKNVQEIFTEYKMAMRSFKKIPILLFNEADGLLSVRNKVNDSVDQMSNTMQNIILQELEVFKGIFIATSNLIHNMDSAFDRRFLFKTKLELPEKEVRLKIIKSQFKGFSKSILETLSEESLSGGQIMNIKKKISMEELLIGKKRMSLEKLRGHLDSETRFRVAGKRELIGYKNFK